MYQLTYCVCPARNYSRQTIKLISSVWISGILAISVLFIAVNVSAEGKPKSSTITEEEVLGQALANSPLVKQVDALLAGKIAESISTRLLPNPALDTDVRLPGSYRGSRPDTEVEMALEQPFRLSHFGLRDAVADLISKAGNSDQKIALLELSQKVRLLYARTWALDAQKAVIESAKKRASSVASLIGESSKKGLLPISDSKLFEAESKKLSAETLGIEAEFARSLAELTRVTAIDFGDRKFEKPTLPSALNADELIAQAEGGNIPVQQRARLLSQLASEQRKLAEKDSFPMLAPRLLYQHTAEGEEQYGIGIRIELPFFDRNQAERMKRTAEESAANAEQQYFLGSAFKSQVSLFAKSLNASANQVKIYETQVIPALQEALRGSEQQLRAGQGSVLQVFQTQREINDATSKVVELWVKALSDKAELSVLIGADL